MDRSVFERTIRDFWSHLALGEPVFDEDDVIVLEVDDLDVALKPGDDDETLVVEMRVGQLCENDSVRRVELEKVLKLNFALSPARDTLTVCERDAGKPGVIFARGFYRTTRHDFEKLSDLVYDVISTFETLRVIIADDNAPVQFGNIAGRTRETSAGADFLILKP
ncbi:Tir chaperone family protein CesT [Breoghania corrubedonensis]|uniref:Tir chaperone family protein CesT n=1 Tax=Breoghania corrubedonensis TaxID=665038 RepID=A0A2T5UYT5_9HYPH|nr:CesT family type III secretion system chaperone [Breoghania corrubedonensis]PTW56673.1 Tir chaperone family protein CesT [Breoghania corrubedonensis]